MQFHSSDVEIPELRNANLDRPLMDQHRKKFRGCGLSNHTPNNTGPPSIRNSVFTDRLRGHHWHDPNKRGKRCGQKVHPGPLSKWGDVFSSTFTHHQTPRKQHRNDPFFFDAWSVYTPDFTSQRITFYTARAEIFE